MTCSQTFWDRPEFVTDPTIASIETVSQTLNYELLDERYIVTTPPSEASEMIVYFTRHGSDMAKCINHRKEASHQ